MDRILSQMYQVYIVAPFFKIHFSSIFPSISRLYKWSLPIPVPPIHIIILYLIVNKYSVQNLGDAD